MFTGLVEEIGQIRSLKSRGEGLVIEINAKKNIASELQVGDSVAVDGVCLTVIDVGQEKFSVEAVSETLSITTLTSKNVGQSVNLERALQIKTRLGGHLVQGHVDGIAEVDSLEKRDPGLWMTIRIPKHLLSFIIEKGPIALDGISLTIAKVDSDLASIALISHTARNTTIGSKNIGDKLNVEVDVIAKYVHKILQPYIKDNGITFDKLSDSGFN